MSIGKIKKTADYLFENSNNHPSKCYYQKNLKEEIPKHVLEILNQFYGTKLNAFYHNSHFTQSESHRKYYDANCIEFEGKFTLIHEDIKTLLLDYLIINHSEYYEQNCIKNTSLSIETISRKNAIYYFNNFIINT